MGFHIIGTAFGVLTIWASFLSAPAGGQSGSLGTLRLLVLILASFLTAFSYGMPEPETCDKFCTSGVRVTRAERLFNGRTNSDVKRYPRSSIRKPPNMVLWKLIAGR
ncbi:hypothetical protein VTN00DRAFT_7093 [Thermoascus crustaceus]|uniref:uncharacterized protein n=1 Tax=Thermoascus crustaceus TaxID=5088 RepID=UPI0037436BD2